MDSSGVDYIDVYDKLYEDILDYVKYKSDKQKYMVVHFDSLDVKEDFLDSEYATVEYIREDNIDDFIECNKYNYRDNSVISFNNGIYFGSIIFLSTVLNSRTKINIL